MRDLELIIQDVSDPVVRENFDRLQKLADDDLFGKFKGKHVEIERAKDGTYSYQHNLGYRPHDVLQTSLITDGAATLVWNYADFNRTSVSFTVAGLGVGETITVRAFIGSYVEQ